MGYVAAVVGGTALLGAVMSSKDAKAAASAQRASIAQNEAGRAFTEQQLGLSLAGMEQAYPLGNAARNTGYNLGVEMSDQGYRGATDMTTAGMQQYQNAIMGLPVDYSQLQAPTFNYTDLTTAFDQEAQAPTVTPSEGGLREGLTAGVTTNADLLRASGEDPEWINGWVNGMDEDSANWSQFKNADEAIASLSRDPEKLGPDNYTKLSNMFRNMFTAPGTESGGTWAGLGRSLASDTSGMQRGMSPTIFG
jgi:hypothetical protein